MTLTLSGDQLEQLEQAVREANAEIALATTREQHIRVTAHANRLNNLLASVYGIRSERSA